jgi:tetratricopeptide (TPR) repeat protein
VNYLENELEYYLKITENVVTPEIYYNIAFIYQRMDMYEKAVEYWRKVVDISPDTNIGKVSSVYIDKYQKNIEN